MVGGVLLVQRAGRPLRDLPGRWRHPQPFADGGGQRAGGSRQCTGLSVGGRLHAAESPGDAARRGEQDVTHPLPQPYQERLQHEHGAAAQSGQSTPGGLPPDWKGLPYRW